MDDRWTGFGGVAPSDETWVVRADTRLGFGRYTLPLRRLRAESIAVNLRCARSHLVSTSVPTRTCHEGTRQFAEVDPVDEPLASREGFGVWLECGHNARRLEVKECHHADERMLFVSPTGLAPVGDRHDRCEVRIELATESQRWWDTNWGVVLRSQLYEGWISRPADRRPQR